MRCELERRLLPLGRPARAYRILGTWRPPRSGREAIGVFGNETGISTKLQLNQRICNGTPASDAVSAITGLPEPRLICLPGSLMILMAISSRLPFPQR